jgi:hypothetical protein
MAVIPLSDASRRPTRFPVVTATIILINVLVFLAELAGGESFVTNRPAGWPTRPMSAASSSGPSPRGSSRAGSNSRGCEREPDFYGGRGRRTRSRFGTIPGTIKMETVTQTTPPAHKRWRGLMATNGAYRDRTGDPLLAKQVLCKEPMHRSALRLG